MARHLLLPIAHLAHYAIRHAATHAARYAATHAARHAATQISKQPINYLVGQSASKPVVNVSGYPSKNGYVSSHLRSTPDSTKLNNWSYVGNINPYTGKKGTKTS